ncbi:MAG: aminotransferase class III-fold pyridoxal phosphate-dependent enzyme [Bacteriovoracaceae bacterium]|nr:aminotransferase class III-fold pyridoxal phosphate-dependent enzyme [Bacteriovoracaceae bacterium]
MKENKNLPYFITWTSQEKAQTLPLDKVDNDFFYGKGIKWLNLSSISYQASFGLKNTTILKAIKSQMDEFSLASPKHTYQLKEEVSKRLISKTGSGFKCFFTLSGSEGIENALKIARQFTKKKIILSQKNSYHGSTMGALAITGDWRQENHLLPRQWTKYFPAPATDPSGEKLEALILKIGPDNIAGICIETITGGNGVFIPPSSWYKAVAKIQKNYNILLILDEVVCAAHRTGPFFGFQNYKNVQPDLIVTAKAMTGGYFPQGVLFVSQKISKYYDKSTLSCGLTNYGHPLGLAAMKAVLDLTEEESFKKKVQKNVEIFTDFFNALKLCEIDCRHIGLLGAIEMNNKIKLKDLLDSGIYAGIQNGRIILAPNLLIPSKVLTKGLNDLGMVIHDKLT